MIDGTLWKLRESKAEHLGIILSANPAVFPLHTVLCSHSGMEGEMGEAQRPAPDAFETGTRVCYDIIRSLDPDLFWSGNPLVRFKWQLSDGAFKQVLEDFQTLYTTGTIVGPGRL